MTRAEYLFVIVWIINFISSLLFVGSFVLCSSERASGQK